MARFVIYVMNINSGRTKIWVSHRPINDGNNLRRVDSEKQVETSATGQRRHANCKVSQSRSQTDSSDSEPRYLMVAVREAPDVTVVQNIQI